MRRFSLLLALVCAMLTAMTGCGKYREITLCGGKIETVSLSGLRSANLVMSVNVHNPAGKLDARQIDGTLTYFGKVLGKVTLNPFIVDARSDKTYRLSAKVELAEGVGIRQLMALMNGNALNDCLADIDIRGYVAGIKVQKKIRNKSLKELLEL